MIAQTLRPLASCILGFALTLSGFVAAQTPPLSFPVVTGASHVLRIQEVCADATGRLLLIVGEEGVAKIWDSSTRRLLHEIRVPRRSSFARQSARVAAMSADGKCVALGGYGLGPPLNGVLLVDTASGKPLGTIDLGQAFVRSMKFSPDSQFLAVTCIEQGPGNGAQQGKAYLRIYRPTGGAHVVEASHSGYKDVAVDWHPTAGLAMVSYDGVWLYSGNTAGNMLALKQNIRTHMGRGGSFPVAFSADGRSLAVGVWKAVDVYDTSALAYRKTIEVGGPAFGVAWGRDGASTFVSGASDSQRRGLIQKFTPGFNAKPIDVAVASNTVGALHSAGQGKLLFGADDGAWGIFSEEGRIEWQVAPDWFCFDGVNDGLYLNADASAVIVDTHLVPKRRIAFSLTQRKLTELSAQGALPAGYTRPRQTMDGLEFEKTEELSGGKVTLHGKPLSMPAPATGLAVFPTGKRFLKADLYGLRDYSATGAASRGYVAPGGCTAVNLSQDGSVAVVTSTDGSVRWIKTADMTELFALHITRDAKRWVLYTPQGCYDVSADSHDLIGMHTNTGKPGEATFTPMPLMTTSHYRPDIINAVWESRDLAKSFEFAGIPVKPPPPAKIPVPQ